MNVTEYTKAAQQTLLSVWNIQGTARPLAGERDLNFRIDVDGRARYVLKVMHAGCAPELVDLQCAVLEKLAACPGLVVPRAKRTVAGELAPQTDWLGQERCVWLVDFLHGSVMAEIAPLRHAELVELGRWLGRLNAALVDFEHDALDRPLLWNLTVAHEQRASVSHVDSDIRDAVGSVLDDFAASWQERLLRRPAQAIHNDVNDFNVILEGAGEHYGVAGLIDFGDVARQPVICEVAIACAYAAMDQNDEIAACCSIVEGYVEASSLDAEDIALLLPLICARLAVSLCVSSTRRAGGENDPYAMISHEAAKRLFVKLMARESGIVAARLRAAAGLAPCPATQRVTAFLNSATLYPVMPALDAPVLDLGVGSPLLGADPAQGKLDALTRHIDGVMAEHRADTALGRYLEARMLYASESFGVGGYPCDERRTVHLGIDIFTRAGAAVRAPLPAKVHRIARIDLPLDYGPLIILQHQTPDGALFFTLYGHLEAASIANLSEGQHLEAGAVFCRIGAPPENGGWPPHLHLQLIVEDFGLAENFPGVCTPAEETVYRALSPNPAALLGREDEAALDASADAAALATRRQRLIGPSLALSYAEPLHIVRGFGTFLYDDKARAYLDFYNNVAHVGHCHPRVVDAVQRQIGLLNTNTRYLHERMLDYAERLVARLPDPLEVCLFVNSASEANELALRMARQVTGRRDMIVAADAYHGHTSALIELSPYKYNGPGGAGPSDWVHEVPVADDYRGAYRRGEADIGPRYARHVSDLLESLGPEHACAGFIAETLPSVGGQIILPEGYLSAVYAAVRADGGLCIADEVQTGFGRLGEAFWGFEDEGVTPDMVVLGKPIANGFPMGAVVTTREIAEAFDTGMEFFATFGGNAVACAAASAVLDVVEQEQLAQNAASVGGYFLEQLRNLQSQHALIGDVRGKGFFVGVELVHDRQTLEPAADAAAFVANELRRTGLLAGTDGPLHNVIKLRPTMVTRRADVEYAIGLMDRVLRQAERRFSRR